ncbi:Pentatricopeptide repeat-containing protein [Nymphaea thermarum]|nr:Pentatricopeptide repeat-containing protein [Nymphaea thermarum]
MNAKEIEPNVVTFSALIDGLCERKMTSKRVALNMVTYSSLVSGLCQENKIQEALEILDRMKLQGWKPDARLYNKVVVDLCDLHRFREAANFLDEMILSGVIPNRVTHGVHTSMQNMVLQGLCDKEDANRAFMVYQNTRALGISAEPRSCSALVDYLCKKGLLKLLVICLMMDALLKNSLGMQLSVASGEGGRSVGTSLALPKGKREEGAIGYLALVLPARI